MNDEQPATPIKQAEPGEMPSYGQIPWPTLRAVVAEAQIGKRDESYVTLDPSYSFGHQIVSMNWNSLNRIVSTFAATPQQPAAASAGASALVKAKKLLRDFFQDDVGYYRSRELMAEVASCIDAALHPPPAKARPTDDELWDQTLRERDTYCEWADKLAEAISRFIGFDIGEHSSANNPWARALDMIPAGTLGAALQSPPAAPARWEKLKAAGFTARPKITNALGYARDSDGEDEPTPTAHVGDSNFELWYEYSCTKTANQKQLARDAYAAGIGEGATIATLACNPPDRAVATAQQSEAPRCSNCDDTGDVHGRDGEWRGRCHCKFGRAHPAAGEATERGSAA